MSGHIPALEAQVKKLEEQLNKVEDELKVFKTDPKGFTHGSEAWQQHASILAETRLVVARSLEGSRKALADAMAAGSPAGGAGGGSTMGPPADPMGRFRRLLPQPDATNEDVMKYLRRHFALQIPLVDTTEGARDLYNQACQMPHSTTRLVAASKGLLINGNYLPNVPSRGTLLYAVWEDKPRLLKIPRSTKECQYELNVWRQLAHGNTSHLAGPLEGRMLEGTAEGLGPVKMGILMPIFPMTLQHYPVPVPEHTMLHAVEQLAIALGHMHEVQLCHCDVKAPNVLVDSQGQFFLTDYGSTRTTGDYAEEKTMTHVPVDIPPSQLNVDVASPQLDFLLLAVTVLGRLGHLDLSGHTLKLNAVVKAAAALKPDGLLRSELQQMVPWLF